MCVPDCASLMQFSRFEFREGIAANLGLVDNANVRMAGEPLPSAFIEATTKTVFCKRRLFLVIGLGLSIILTLTIEVLNETTKVCATCTYRRLVIDSQCWQAQYMHETGRCKTRRQDKQKKTCQEDSLFGNNWKNGQDKGDLVEVIMVSHINSG